MIFDRKFIANNKKIKLEGQGVITLPMVLSNMIIFQAYQKDRRVKSG